MGVTQEEGIEGWAREQQVQRQVGGSWGVRRKEEGRGGWSKENKR